MKENIKNLWVEALRSGKYTQTKRRLKNDEGYCCLGVLCEISSLDTFIKENNSFSCLYLGNYGMPPKKVIEWAGLKLNDKQEELDPLDYLAELNDSKGKSFDEIADYIEANWKDL